MTYPTLGARMKAYEQIQDFYLTPRTPAILRVDGKAFHTWCRQNCQKATPGYPYDITFMSLMNYTACRLLDEVQGAQFAYVQSDEISILIHYYKNTQQEPWFGGRISKIESVSASVASVNFSLEAKDLERAKAYFDARVRNYPEHEVNNYFIWRQQDQIRNSVFSYANSFFSSKQLHGKKRPDMLEMMQTERNFDWNSLNPIFKLGRVVFKDYSAKAINFLEDREFVAEFLKVES